MTMTPDNVEFKPGNMNQNFEALLGHFGLSSEDEVDRLVARFSIFSAISLGGLAVIVDEGKRKTALLLLYLARKYGNGETLIVTGNVVREINKFFPRDIIRDATRNRHTLHQSLRALLSSDPDPVRVEILLGDYRV